MAYVKRGPFVDASPTGPYVDAAFFNAVEDVLVQVVPSGAPNSLTGWFHVDQYGAVGDGTTIDRVPIQAAITAANTAYKATGARQFVYLPPRVHLVDETPFFDATGTVQGAMSIQLLDGVELFGPGTIKVKNNAHGINAQYAVIRSGTLSQAAIRGITVDGNNRNQIASTQCDNIHLEVITQVEVTGTRHVNANGNGIMLTGTYAVPMTSVRISGNNVNNCQMVGIQASFFNGLEIDDNLVEYCTNNCIDINGENGSTTSIGTNFAITNNRVHHGLVGIFPETVAYGVVEGNVAWSCTEAGIHVNRVNGAPIGIYLTGNLIHDCPAGIYITGDMGSIYIRGNTVVGATTAGIQMGGGGSTLSHVFIDGNFLDTSPANSVPLVLVASGTNVWTASFLRNTGTQNTNRSYDLVNYATNTNAVSASTAFAPGSF